MIKKRGLKKCDGNLQSRHFFVFLRDLRVFAVRPGLMGIL